jgi:hypothetical protein
VLERVAEEDKDPVGVERLLEDVVGAQLRCLDRRLDRRVPADHDHARRRVDLADALQALESIHARHLHVEEREVGSPLLEGGNAGGRVRLGSHLVPLVLQELAQGGADPLFVVDDQDAVAHLRRRYKVT